MRGRANLTLSFNPGPHPDQVALYENKDMMAVLTNIQSLGRVAQVAWVRVRIRIRVRVRVDVGVRVRVRVDPTPPRRAGGYG